MSVDPYDRRDDDDVVHHVCRRCGKAGLWRDFAPDEPSKRVLWEKRPRGHNGPHECDLSSHFEAQP